MSRTRKKLSFHAVHPAFTLVELLVVIAIIGLLSSVAVVATGTAREKAKIAKANADIQQIYKQIEVARNNYNTVLRYVTASTCSDCVCRVGTDLSVLPGDHGCIIAMTNAFTNMGFPGLLRDPWGSPYLMDENELENGSCGGQDSLFSAGPDKIDQYGTGDDINFWVPYYQCP